MDVTEQSAQNPTDAEFVQGGDPNVYPSESTDVSTDVIVVTDEEAVAVAKAMDPDDTMNWDSTDHSDIVECINAKEKARIFILGCRAYTKLESGQLKVEEPAALVQPDSPPEGVIDPPPEDQPPEASFALPPPPSPAAGATA